MIPKLSIVIANYNYGRFLGEAIRSVIEQDGFDECELIVVDGRSTDSSVEIIKKYAEKIAWWVSEKDKGQSDAFNKGFAHARGRLGCWVNADDILLPGTLRAVLDCIKRHPSVDWITGGVVYFDSDGKIMWMRVGSGTPFGFHFWNYVSVIGGPSSFFNIEKMKKVGGFDLDCNYMMDTDLWIRLFSAGLRPRHINRYFWSFRSHLESKTASALASKFDGAFCAEARRIRKRYVITKWQKRMGGLVVRLCRVLNGSYLKSFVDTRLWRGCKLDCFCELHSVCK